MEFYWVYILENTEKTLYKGFTTDLDKRLEYHNTGKSSYTRGKGPWEMVFVQKFKDKTEALKYERMQLNDLMV